MTSIDNSTDLLLERLSAASLPEGVSDLVLAACLGEDDLTAVLGGASLIAPPPLVKELPGRPRLFLSDLAVEGFRGIAGRAQLGLKPGPGITLVVGRNGSGKSSFADAAELALTGSASRWATKSSKVWEDGWACLHYQGPRTIELRLVAEGQQGQLTVRRTWSANDGLENAKATVQRQGEPQQPLESLGLRDAMLTWRPFLSYSELGGLVEEGPSKLYDAISGVLGLEPWVEVEDRLATVRKQIEADVKEAKKEADRLRVLLEELDDERAAAALVALPKRGSWDLDAIEELATGAAAPMEGAVLLESLTRVAGPDPQELTAAVDSLRSAIATVSQLADTDATRASDLGDLLEQALTFHSGHEGSDCPVCGTTSVLDDQWLARTQEAVTRLKREAADVRSARQALTSAVHRATGLIEPAPSAVIDAGAAVDNAPVATAWAGWVAAPNDPAALADHLESDGSVLAAAIEDVRQAAQAELNRRRDQWQPVAAQLTRWLPMAARSQEPAGRINDLKAAATWVDEAITLVRNERFAPIADSVRRLWEFLRQSSTVELTDVRLEGTKTRRRVALEVSVDDVEGAGISVMSQGELHAIALSLFLPRATLPESPFGFIVIDDPVQSMDASKVDGLARVFEDVAKDRQVIVFTHDERLPDACRRLGIEARVLEVNRGPHSEVSVRAKTNPVDDYLRDARAILKTADYPVEARRRVVPGLCRNAVEAACVDAARRRLLQDGVAFDVIDARIDQAGKLLPRMALALFGDAARAGDVLGALNGRFGPWAGDCVKVLGKGAHEEVDRDPESLIDDAARLAHKIAELG
jgi:recombinational DNA repair ATPase RecF